MSRDFCILRAIGGLEMSRDQFSLHAIDDLYVLDTGDD